MSGSTVHLVGDHDLGRRVGCVRQRKRALETQLGAVGVCEHRVEVIRPVVGSVEADIEAVRGRSRLFQDVG